MISLADLLGGLDLDETLMKSLAKDEENETEFAKLMQEKANLVVLAKSVQYLRQIDPERKEQPTEYKAFVNLLKLLLVESANNPYWSSRIGWLMWFWACYARQDSRFPMKWRFHYDPLNWYRHDEPLRPPELECPPADDPHNIRGECAVNPEWYRGKDGKTGPEGK